MKKICSLSLGLFCYVTAQAQVINSFNWNDNFFPPLAAPAPLVYNPLNHVACFDQDDTPYGTDERYSVWASNYCYPATGIPTNTLAWRHVDGAGVLIDEGFIDDIQTMVNGETAIELEPAVFRDGGNVYVAVAYYSSNNTSNWTGSGHFLNIYQWSGGTLTLAGQMQLSSLPKYTRISIDAYKEYALAITWADPAGIQIKTWYQGTISQTLTIQGTQNGQVPDVAISSGNGGWDVRVAYLMDNVLNVYSQSLTTIQGAGGPTIPFNYNDSWLTSYYYLPAFPFGQYGNYKSDFARAYHQLAAPVQYFSGSPSWTVAYNDAATQIKARVCYNGTVSNVNISSMFTWPAAYPYTNAYKDFPTVTYQTSAAGTPGIYFGFNVETSATDASYFAVKTNFNGSSMTGYLNFMQVSDPLVSTTYRQFAGIAFPKNTLSSQDLFIAYTGKETNSGNTFQITKNIPWTDIYFKQAPGNTGVENRMTNGIVTAGPNPFTDRILFHAADMDARYAVTVTDVAGRRVLTTENSLGNLNKAGDLFHNLPAGMLLFNLVPLEGNGSAQNMKLIKH